MCPSSCYSCSSFCSCYSCSCSSKTKFLILSSLTFGLCLEIILFLSLFFIQYDDNKNVFYPLIGSLVVSLAITNICSLIFFFILEQRTNNDEVLLE